MPDGPLLLTIDQAAVALAVSPRTLENLIADGRISSLKVGRLRRVPRAALDRFIENSIAEVEGDVEQLPAEALRLVRRARSG